MASPAFALIDRDHQVLRSTHRLRELDAGWEAACAGSDELQRVLLGEAESATLHIGETSFAVDAVMDSAGAPRALLTMPGETPPSAFEPDGGVPVGHLRAALDESPVIGWLKDPGGRYMHVNARYLDDLSVTADRLLGHRDQELSPSETVDGPRLIGTEDGVEEPEDLEYAVPAFADRPAFTAIRFMIRDQAGEPVALCGVAAPVEESHTVRDEAGRILKIERWSRMSSAAVRSELLKEWGLELGTAEERHELPAAILASDTVPAPPEEPRSETMLAAPAPSPRSESNESWEACLRGLQDQAKRWQDELGRARAERDTAVQALAAERERTDELVRAIARLRSQITDLGHAIDDALPLELDR